MQRHLLVMIVNDLGDGDNVKWYSLHSDERRDSKLNDIVWYRVTRNYSTWCNVTEQNVIQNKTEYHMVKHTSTSTEKLTVNLIIPCLTLRTDSFLVHLSSPSTVRYRPFLPHCKTFPLQMILSGAIKMRRRRRGEMKGNRRKGRVG